MRLIAEIAKIAVRYANVFENQLFDLRLFQTLLVRKLPAGIERHGYKANIPADFAEERGDGPICGAVFLPFPLHSRRFISSKRQRGMQHEKFVIEIVAAIPHRK